MSCTLIQCSNSVERCFHDNKPTSYRFTPVTRRLHFDRSLRVRTPSRRAVKSFLKGMALGKQGLVSASSLTPAPGTTLKQKRAGEY